MRLAQVPSSLVPLAANLHSHGPRHRRVPGRVDKRGTRFFSDQGCLQCVSVLGVYFCGASYCYFYFSGVVCSRSRRGRRRPADARLVTSFSYLAWHHCPVWFACFYLGIACISLLLIGFASPEEPLLDAQPLANARVIASAEQRMILLRRLVFVFITVSFIFVWFVLLLPRTPGSQIDFSLRSLA